MRVTVKIKVLLILLCVAFTLMGCGNGGAPVEPGGAGNVEYTKGTLTDTSFESEFAGIKYAVPSEYVMATSEEIDEMIDFGGEIVYSDADKKILDYAKANTVYEMMVSHVGGVPNAIVFAEKLPFKNITVEQYVEELKKQLSSGELIYKVEALSTETLAGQEYSLLPCRADVEGVVLKQDYLLRKVGNRLVGIIVTYTDDTVAEKDRMIAAFEPYAAQ